LRINSNRPSKA